MKKLWPFTLLVAAFFVSCGEEVIQTVYVPDSDTVYLETVDTLVLTETDTIFLTEYDTVIVFANCDQPFAIGDTFDLESGPYYFEEDSSFIALGPPFNPFPSGYNWDFSSFHNVFGQDEEEDFIIFRNIVVVCGYVPKEDELAYLWIDTNGFVYLWAIQVDENTFRAEIIYPLEYFDPLKQIFTKHVMRRRQ